jgi:outer membrane receptor protein involved in Fe transport
MNHCRLRVAFDDRATARRRTPLARGVALALLAAATAVPAAAAFAAEGDTVRLEEIVVTAQKREQSVQEVPVSVLAINAGSLEAAGVTGVQDLDMLAAGLTVAASDAGALNISMRGISNLGGGLLTGPSVGYYVDETPLSSFSQLMPQIAFWDAERVEVLRGPQGTLFGEGSMGGTIRVITKKPDSNDFAAAFKADYSSVSDGDEGLAGWGMVNIPILSDKLALRVAASRQELPGWVDIPDLGLEDENEATQEDVRAALRWTPSDNLIVDLSYSWQKLETGWSAATSPGVYEPSALDPGMQAVAVPSPRDSEYDLFNLTASYDLGFATLVASASSFDMTRNALTDNTPAVTKFFGPVLGAGGTAFQVARDVDIDTQTVEVRLVSNDDDRLRWTVGGYFKDDERVQGGTGFIISLPVIGLVDDQSLASVRATAEAWAAFADVEYQLTDTLSLQAGIRHYDAEIDQLIRFETTSLIFGTVEGVEQPSSGSYSDTLPKIGLSWTPIDNLMLYVKYSEGFRDGGSNYQPPGYPEIPAAYEPENVEAVEIGVKSQPADWLVLNASIYQNTWSELQLPFLTSDALFNYIENAGKAKSTGGEIEIVALPTTGLRLALGLGYVEAEIDEDVFNALGIPIATKGNRVPFSPEIQASLSASYDFPLTESLRGALSASYAYRDETESDAANTDYLRNDSYDNLFLRVGVNGKNWGIGVYGSNLTDSDATVSKSPFAGALVAYGTYVQPRTVGVELNVAF